MSADVFLPGLGSICLEDGFTQIDSTSDGLFRVACGGVATIVVTGDRKVEFVGFADHTLAHVVSAMGYPAYYPLYPIAIDRPVQAVLMDLDGTSVRSEDFWIWIIQLSTASLLNNPRFELEQADIPYVSGHSVSEHLQHCIRKYCPDKTVEEARNFYFEHTRREMAQILAGRGRKNAFKPTPGLEEFLCQLKADGMKVGVVSSGLYEKAWPEIVSAFDTLGMGDPKAFYDVIVTAGFPLRKGEPGTLGELSPKPHPWLYAEAARVGLGIPFERRNTVVGIEDSGAGICSLRLAGFAPIGLAEGNIIESGTRGLCAEYCETLDDVYRFIKG